MTGVKKELWAIGYHYYENYTPSDGAIDYLTGYGIQNRSTPPPPPPAQLRSQQLESPAQGNCACDRQYNTPVDAACYNPKPQGFLLPAAQQVHAEHACHGRQKREKNVRTEKNGILEHQMLNNLLQFFDLFLMNPSTRKKGEPEIVITLSCATAVHRE